MNSLGTLGSLKARIAHVSPRTPKMRANCARPLSAMKIPIYEDVFRVVVQLQSERRVYRVGISVRTRAFRFLWSIMQLLTTDELRELVEIQVVPDLESEDDMPEWYLRTAGRFSFVEGTTGWASSKLRDWCIERYAVRRVPRPEITAAFVVLTANIGPLSTPLTPALAAPAAAACSPADPPHLVLL
jgi:hypothetical protein